MKTGDFITCVNIFTGTRTMRKILAVSKSANKITVERADWKTGKADFTLSPSMGVYRNHYSAEQFRD